MTNGNNDDRDDDMSAGQRSSGYSEDREGNGNRPADRESYDNDDDGGGDDDICLVVACLIS